MEWMRNNGGAIRNPLDIVCGGLPYVRSIYTAICLLDEETQEEIKLRYRQAAESRDSIIPHITHKIADQTDHRQMRVKYIIGSITKKDFLGAIKRKDKFVQYSREMLFIYDTYCVLIEEKLRNIAFGDKLHPQQGIVLLEEFERIIEYINTQLNALSENYGLRKICV
jgi:hypothetical protein